MTSRGGHGARGHRHPSRTVRGQRPRKGSLAVSYHQKSTRTREGLLTGSVQNNRAAVHAPCHGKSAGGRVALRRCSHVRHVSARLAMTNVARATSKWIRCRNADTAFPPFAGLQFVSAAVATSHAFRSIGLFRVSSATIARCVSSPATRTRIDMLDRDHPFNFLEDRESPGRTCPSIHLAQS